MENLKPAEQSTRVRTPLSATKSGGSQDGKHREASSAPAASMSSGHTQPENEVPQAEEVLWVELLPFTWRACHPIARMILIALWHTWKKCESLSQVFVQEVC